MNSYTFNPQSKNQLELRKSWELFMEKGIISSHIPPMIAESWKSHRQKNIDPLRPKVDLDLHTYDKYMNSNEYIIESSTNIIKDLGKYLDCISVELFNADALLVKMYGDQKIINRLSEINNAPGGMHDTQAGTNAITLALEHKKPAFVAGAEHFCSMFHELSCFAMPIFNRNTNKVQSVIDITGPVEVFNSHIFGLVHSTRAAIQKNLDNIYLEQDTILFDYFQNQFLYGPYAALIINSDKVIIRCSEKAAQLLGTYGKDWNKCNVSSLGIANLDFHLELNENEIEFYSTLGHDLDVRIVVNRISHKKLFQGWLMRLIPVVKTGYKPTEKNESLFNDLIGNSPAFQAAINTAKKIASSQATVLILGETGTGKEMFAKAIHNSSNRSDKPFVTVNCGAIPKELIGSELFGYEEGAFSGAKKGGQKGKFELANGGTIFLDEIGELPLEHQVYLLRVLQEREFYRLGGKKTISVDVRVIAATNVDLIESIKNKTSRGDLYFRLNILSLRLPSLQERGREDIIRLINYFVVLYNRNEGKNVSITKEALDLMATYQWKGNVRELENSVYRLIVLAEHPSISPEDVRLILGETIVEEVDNLIKGVSMDEIERKGILQVLRHHNGNLTKAAKQLNISRATLYRKMEKYQINTNRFSSINC
jgi:transcriptional regulator with PAS, ATPase and Fis domain